MNFAIKRDPPNDNVKQPYGQFPVSGISRADGILDNEMLLSRNNLFNFRATFSPVNKRISARSENFTDWKLAFKAN